MRKAKTIQGQHRIKSTHLPKCNYAVKKALSVAGALLTYGGIISSQLLLLPIQPTKAQTLPNRSCSQAFSQFDWSRLNWTDGELGPRNFTVDGVTYTVEVKNPNRHSFTDDSPKLGDNNFRQPALFFRPNMVGGGFIEVHVTMSRPITGVQGIVDDVDEQNSGGGTWQDEVVITGFLDNNAVNPTLRAFDSSNVRVAGNIATGTTTTNFSTGGGHGADVEFGFGNQAINKFIVRYRPGPDVNNHTSAQHVTLNSWSFCADTVQTTYQVSGTLYEDSDRGDDLDTSEPKLPQDITVNLLDNNNNVLKTTTTDANGAYTFIEVADGNYKIQVDTSDADIPNGYILGTPNDLPVNVSGSTITNQNFGFDKPIDKIPDPPPTTTDPTPPGGICAAPGSDGSVTLSGVINTYYPGAASVSAGSSSINLGAINSNGNTTPISKGDKLLIIQMQDAEINSTNTDAYGNGNPGGAASGSTALNTSGYYQYVVADNDVPTTGGTLQIKESLAYTFTNVDATATTGQRRFQIVRLPQHINATISSTVTAAPWNGSSGGIFALDVSKTLTFSGGTIDVSGQGFRGGGGVNVNGNNTPLPAPGNTDYVNLSTQPFHGSKGEGIAGTPRLMRNDVTTTVTDNGMEGYPNGSFGRGAPGNAGGGSTDPNQQNNAANTGGGGGANHGYGGHGGDSWTDGYGRQPTGGYGGQAFPTSFNRIIMGGGGGAGTANNSPNGPTPSGGGGGGIVILRAGQITGTGNIEANGIQGVEPQGTDGGGGGGAGGSVMVLSVDPSSASLTINARGGKGLDSGFREHGPGGGGGGGYVAYQGLTPIADVSGGQPGNDKAGGTVNPDPDPYGATAGGVGLAQAATIPEAGVKAGAECLIPNVLLVKRITKINDSTTTNNGDNLAIYNQDNSNPYDDNKVDITELPENPGDPKPDTDKWKGTTSDTSSTFLIGGINGGKVKPGDEIEYTIYYLSTGDTEAKNVLICDRIPTNTSFISTSFNTLTPTANGGLSGADRGITWLSDGIEISLTNAEDGDAGQYFPPGTDPKTVYPDVNCGGENTNGAIVVNLGDLPNATGIGAPTTSYGSIRFRGRVK